MNIPEGELTSVVYELIRDRNWADAVDFLTQLMSYTAKNRAGLSLLGFCYYNMEDYESAAKNYDELVALMPLNESYRLTLANCYYKAGLYQEALKATSYDFSPKHAHDALVLRVVVRLEMDDLAGSRKLIAQLLQGPTDAAAVYVAQGCIHYKDDKLDEALKAFEVALSLERSPVNLYAVALTHFRLSNYPRCINAVRELVECSAQAYPEFSFDLDPAAAGPVAADGVQSVRNSRALRDSSLVEAFNLKVAVEWALGSAEGAQEALRSLPPREEEELDAVTLHNVALLEMDAAPAEGFKKMRHLLCTPPFPPEAFGNLLILYVKHDLPGLAADLLADNPVLASSCLEAEELAFLEAVLDAQTSPERAYTKLDALAARHMAALRRQQHSLQRLQKKGSDEEIRAVHQAYEEHVRHFIPVLMAQTGILYDAGSRRAAEAKLRQAADFCSEHAAWHLNLGHALFVQDQEPSPRFADAAKEYEAVLEATQTSDVLSVPAVALANLCASYVMLHQNDAAEQLMQRIDSEEQDRLHAAADAGVAAAPSFHLCIVNLVVGILYCVKQHMQFGVVRVMKGLEPLRERLGPDTWFYAKRPLLALLDQLAKRVLVIPDDLLADVLAFLDQCAAVGERVPVDIVSDNTSAIQSVAGGGAERRRTIADEARMLKAQLLAL